MLNGLSILLNCYYRLSEIVFFCKNQRKDKGNCNARLRKDRQSVVFSRNGPAHNHPPESELQRQLAFVNACALEALTSRDPPREIFDRVRRQFPRLVVSYNDAMQRRIQRAKRSVQPRIPTTIDEAAELLMTHPEYRYKFLFPF